MGTRRIARTVRSLAAALGLLATSLSGSALAQEKPTPEVKPAEGKSAEGKSAEAKPLPIKPQEPKPDVPLPKLAGADDAQREMIELFHQVEAKLHEIDKLLYDAGAGGAVGGPVEDAGIDRLLRDAGERSAAVQQGIDRILELARQQQQQQQQSSSGGSGQPKPEGESPLDQQRQQGEQEREKRSPGQAPDQKDDSKDPAQQGDPKNPQDSKDDPKQQPGSRVPKDPTGPASARVDDRERWGELPEQVRDVFRVQGGGDLPPRYRDFIDGYYRRMSKRP